MLWFNYGRPCTGVVVQFKLWSLCFLISSLTGCNADSPAHHVSLQTIIVREQPSITPLYLTGTIAPLNITQVIAPFAGRVTRKLFSYGAKVKQGQLLLVINSSEYNDAYQAALATYLTAGRDYARAQTKLHDTAVLKRLGIIANDEYLSSQDQLYESTLMLTQAAYKLRELLQSTTNNLALTQLNNATKIKPQTALQLQDQPLKIYAPNAGIVLTPAKDASESDTAAPLEIGTTVKTEQDLIGIGDDSGISLNVNIAELYINAVQIGQKAVITGAAFTPVLAGQVTEIAAQATQTESDSMPTFRVKIAVPQLTQAQRQTLRMGMSAKVALQLSEPEAISVPLQAVTIQDGNPYVKIIAKTTRKIITVPVVTGATTLTSVVIQHGLQSGDEVVINANNNSATAQ